MNKISILLVVGMALAFDASAKRQMMSTNEGIVLIEGNSIKFGVLGKILHANSPSSTEPQFKRSSELLNNPSVKEETIISALDRISEFHPILAKKLMDEFQKENYPIKYIELYDDPLPLPEELKASKASRLFMWSDITNSYLVDNHLYVRLSSLEQAKVSLYIFLEQLGFMTSTERLEAFVDFVYSSKARTMDKISSVAIAEEALNLRLGELPSDINEALNKNWLKADRSIHIDSKTECLIAADLSKDKQIEGEKDRFISLLDQQGNQKALVIPAYELAYVYPLAEAIGTLSSAHQYQNLYGKGLEGTVEKAKNRTDRICFKRVPSPKRKEFVKLEALVFDFSGQIDELPQALDNSIAQYTNYRNKLAANSLLSEYGQTNKEYLKSENPDEREKLGEFLNGLNIQILGVESGLAGSILNIDSSRIKKAFESKGNRFNYKIVISFANKSGPTLELKDSPAEERKTQLPHP
ncbi:MAG: hypothetical protein IPL83_03865 [Bdellovibrionales bacterium]|nr:hypothetical protein [Bdellovibrionales bacterium]